MGTAKNTIERMNQIVSIVKENGGRPISSEDLAKACGMNSFHTLHAFLSYHKDLPQRKLIKALPAGQGGGYVYVGEDEEEKPETKNAEGYPDPTASKAMTNLKKYDYRESQFEPGFVYQIDHFYEKQLVLVLSGYPGTVNCLMVCDVSNQFYDPDICITLLNNEKYYVDPRRIVSIPEKRFDKCKFFVPQSYFNGTIRAAVAECLGLSVIEKRVPVTKVVEKIVEKKVEVPVVKEVEKIVEKKVEVSADKFEHIKEFTEQIKNLEMDLKLAEETAKIWQRALYAVTGYKEGVA